jgi:predicted PilT family ATPase
MSWDAVIIKGPKPSSVEFQQDNFNVNSMGSLQNVIDQIKKSIPNVQSERANYLFYQENELGIEIDINSKDDNNVKDVNVSVRGNGNPIEIITKLCKDNAWEIFDMQEAEFIDLNNPNTGSWIEFTKFREKVVRKYNKKWWQFWK